MRRSEQGTIERCMEESLMFCARGFVVTVGIFVWMQAGDWWLKPAIVFFYGMIGSAVIGAVAKIVRVWGS